VIYAYAVCEPRVASSIPHCRGLGGATLRALEHEGLAAVFSRHRSFRPRPIPEQVLDHERVVEAIMARGVVLPLRFGTQLADETELEALLAERHDELLRSLARVRGKVEIGLRMTPERTSSGGGEGQRTGRGYLLARVRAHRRYEQASRELHAPLAELAAASRIREPRTPAAVLTASYLVDATEVAAFRLQADELGRRQTAMQVLVTGPWPPYSFASEEHG
jgi:hypothetical protein